MPVDVIQIMTAAKASYNPMTIATGNFDLLPHDDLVTIKVTAVAVGDEYLRHAYVRIDGVKYPRLTVAGSFTWEKQLDLAPGAHTIEVEVNSWVGHWEVSALAEYMATGPPALPTDGAKIIPVLIVIGAGILIAAGSWFLTNGFTRLPRMEIPF